jgi:hypothetical protein
MKKPPNQEYCYVSGPISNMKNFNRDAFNAVSAELEGWGWAVCNPIEEDAKRNHDPKDCVVGGNSRADALKADCIFICNRKPTLFVLPDWQQSSGSKAEIALGKSLNCPIKFLRRKKVAEIIRRRMKVPAKR